MALGSARLAYANVFARDPAILADFYMQVFGFREIVTHRSPIYRCIDAGGTELGFNSEAAYDHLNLQDRKPDGTAPVRAYFTFELNSAASVDQAVMRTLGCGGKVVKRAHDTYYNARQAVLQDPEGNIFRVNHRMGPRKPADQVENPPWRR